MSFQAKVLPVTKGGTGLASTTINQILYSSATSTIAGLATANQGVLTTGTSGIPVITAIATNGQLIIGSTAGAPAAATLTAGAGISITNASNSITIAVSGSGFTWTDITGATQTLVIENGYVTNRGGGVTYTLPASATEGDSIRIVGKLGLWVIAQNANQQITVGSSSTTVGVTGSVTATNVGDCIELLCTTGGASSVYRAISFVGNLTIA